MTEPAGRDPWPKCAMPGGCNGIRFADTDFCIRHLHQQGRLDAIPNGVLDGRGVDFQPGDLYAVLDRLTKGPGGRPIAEEVLFDEAIFQEQAVFDGMEIRGDASFKDAALRYGVSLVDVQFRKYADFRGARVSGWLRAVDGQFGGLDLRNTRLEQIDMNGATVGRVWMNSAVVEQVAEFDRCAISEEAHFESAQFDGPVGFAKASFAGPAIFTRAVFQSDAVFSEAQFARPAVFLGSRFKAWAPPWRRRQ